MGHGVGVAVGPIRRAPRPDLPYFNRFSSDYDELYRKNNALFFRFMYIYSELI